MNKGEPNPEGASQPVVAGSPVLLLVEQYDPPEVMSVKADGFAYRVGCR